MPVFYQKAAAISSIFIFIKGGKLRRWVDVPNGMASDSLTGSVQFHDLEIIHKFAG